MTALWIIGASVAGAGFIATLVLAAAASASVSDDWESAEWVAQAERWSEQYCDGKGSFGASKSNNHRALAREASCNAQSSGQ